MLFMGAMYWIYYDTTNDTRYYVESHRMSVTTFAEYVSEIVGHPVQASDTSYANRQKEHGHPISIIR